jgi:hypothetical protein
VVGRWGLGGALLIAPPAIWWSSRAEFGAAEASMVTAPSAEDELRTVETENRDAEETAQRCAHPAAGRVEEALRTYLPDPRGGSHV